MASESEQSPNPQNKLTEEEKKILKECENESFFTRAFPLSAGAIIGVQYLVRTGKIARHPKYGALPKSIIAGGLAYIIGKTSYLPVCRNKILEKIPDSNLAIAIRKGQARHQTDMSKRQQLYPDKLPSGDSGEDNSASTGMVYPADPRSFEGLNDSERPSLDNEVKMPDDPEVKKNSTYDDLRRKNREEYKDRMSKPLPPSQPGAPSYKDSPFMPQKTWPDKPSPNQDSPGGEDMPPQAAPKRKRTNMWGDVIDD